MTPDERADRASRRPYGPSVGGKPPIFGMKACVSCLARSWLKLHALVEEVRKMTCPTTEDPSLDCGECGICRARSFTRTPSPPSPPTTRGRKVKHKSSKPPNCKCSWCQAHYHMREQEKHLNDCIVDAEEDNVQLFFAKERIKTAIEVLRRKNTCGCHGCDQDRDDALFALGYRPRPQVKK